VTRVVRRWAAGGLGALLVAPLLVLLQAGPAAACSCARLSTPEQVRIADVVVAGTVADVVKEGGSGTGDVVLGVVVDRVYKGDAGDGRLVVRTAENSAACGLGTLPVGTRYLLYLDDAAGLRADVCGGSRRATSASLADLENVAGDGGPVAGSGQDGAGGATDGGDGGGEAVGLRPVADAAEPDVLRLAAPGLGLAAAGLLGLAVVTAYRRRRG
jgi:hypothetical protein